MEIEAEILVGRNNWGMVNYQCYYCGYGNVLVVADRNLKKLGLVEKFRSALKRDIIVVDGPKLKKKKGSYDFKGFDVVVGFGGGTNIDQAKLISRQSNIPWFSVPTKGTHAMCTPDASVDVDGKRVSVRCSQPDLMVADLEVITKTPFYLNVADFGDALSSITGIYDCIIAHLDRNEFFDEVTAKMVFSSGQRIMGIKSLNDPIGVDSLFCAELNTAKSIVEWGSSVPTSGLEHSISHALDYLGSKKLHGTQVGLAVLISAPLYDSQKDLHAFLKKIALPYISSSEIRDKCKELGLPLTANEAKIGQRRLVEAFKIMDEVRAKPRYSVFNRFKDFDKEGYLKKLGIV